MDVAFSIAATIPTTFWDFCELKSGIVKSMTWKIFHYQQFNYKPTDS